MRSHFFVVTFIFMFFIGCGSSDSNSNDDTSRTHYSGECLNHGLGSPLSKSSRFDIIDKGDGKFILSAIEFLEENCEENKYINRSANFVLDDVKGSMEDYFSKSKNATFEYDIAKGGIIGFLKGNIEEDFGCGYKSDDKEYPVEIKDVSKCFPMSEQIRGAKMSVSYDSMDNILSFCPVDGPSSECIKSKKQ